MLAGLKFLRFDSRGPEGVIWIIPIRLSAPAEIGGCERYAEDECISNDAVSAVSPTYSGWCGWVDNHKLSLVSAIPAVSISRFDIIKIQLSHGIMVTLIIVRPARQSSMELSATCSHSHAAQKSKRKKKIKK